MKLFSLISLAVFFFSFLAKAENVIKTMTFNADGFSAMSPDLTTAYAGIAGAVCTGDTNKTCNSCTDTTSGSAEACNQNRIYDTLRIKVSFQLNKALASTTAYLQIETDTAGTFTNIGSATIISTGDGVASEVFSIETTWSTICATLGAPGCVPSAALFKSRSIGIGVDGNVNGAIDPDERKVITLKAHFLPTGGPDNTQPFCTSKNNITSPTRYGICNLAFQPGDEKAYIDTAVFAGVDIFSSLDWDGIAIFPIAVANDGSADSTAFSTFKNGKVTPIIRTLETDGSIPNSLIEGSLKNYQRYCLVYGTKNKAQNIYRFVTTGVTGGCITPSEVVGLLNDKHCFISTVAFGSDMAPEVAVFRKFRNEFLLDNYFGKKFVKYYYKYSPAIAGLISESEFLKAAARAFLYPFLGFSYIALRYGFLVALFTFVILFLLFAQISKILFQNKKLFMIFILLISFNLRADLQPEVKKINHPGSSDGLVKIRKDGSYVYDLNFGLKHESNHLRFGHASAPDVSVTFETKNAQGNPSGETTLSFNDFYAGASNFLISYDYERYPWIDKGMLGFQLGFSFMYADGHGRLKATQTGQVPTESIEKFSFLTLPLNLGAVYRLQWKNQQMFAPYVAGGGTYVFLAEKREDRSSIYYTGDFGFYGAGGMLVNLSAFNRETAFELNSEYGISNLWLSLEFRLTEVNSAAFALKNRSFNGGISFDF